MIILSEYLKVSLDRVNIIGKSVATYGARDRNKNKPVMAFDVRRQICPIIIAADLNHDVLRNTIEIL